MSSIFPSEIEEIFIDILAEDNDHSALKACSLVCQAYLPTCRKHIFAFIELNYKNSRLGPHSTTHALERLLSKSPEIADYIRKLNYNIRVADFASPSIQESLRRISRLESFTVDHSVDKLHWSNNPLRPTLLHLLHLPTLTHFKMFGIDNFVVSDLIPCANLKLLDIGHHTTGAPETNFPPALPEHPIQPNEFIAGIKTTTAVMKLCTARRPDGQSVIDFRSLSKITVLEKPGDNEASQELFRRCEKLTDVNVSFWAPREVMPCLANMLRPSTQTLKHIVVNIHVGDFIDDPLFGIPSALEEMRTKSIIESVTIVIWFRTDENCSLGDDWGKLDEVLTQSGWFALKRVSLAIRLTRYARRHSEWEVALRKLPQTQFLRLSKSNSVSFNFEVDPLRH